MLLDRNQKNNFSNGECVIIYFIFSVIFIGVYCLTNASFRRTHSFVNWLSPFWQMKISLPNDQLQQAYYPRFAWAKDVPIFRNILFLETYVSKNRHITYVLNVQRQHMSIGTGPLFMFFAFTSTLPIQIRSARKRNVFSSLILS